MMARECADWPGIYRVGFTILAMMAGLGTLFFVLPA